ncbi:MAG: cytochrome c1 [Rhodospirillales bacterium]
MTGFRFSRLVAGVAVLAGIGTAAYAASEAMSPHVEPQKWSFDGPFGTFDRAEVQRGFQVYRDVCSACHGLSLVAYRNLTDLGLKEDEVKDLIKDIQVQDGPNDVGEMFDRNAKLSDRFKKPFANEQASRAANNGAYPPDLSLLAKAAETESEGGIPVIRSFITKLHNTGADHIFGVLTGYRDYSKLTAADRISLGIPANFKLGEGMYFNIHFKGFQIAMPPPLENGTVTFFGDAPNKLDDMARDVATFLTWAAEPKMEERKRTGVKVVLFLLAMAGLMYAIKRKIWSNVAH